MGGDGSGRKLKLTVYFSDPTLREMRIAANRQDRSLSWIVQEAWKHARQQICASPASRILDGSRGNPAGGRKSGAIGEAARPFVMVMSEVDC
jgi:uncharacterized small protein (TIGR04563 family)